VGKESGDVITSYIKYLTPNNISYLGVDKATQIKNFNVLVSSNKFKAINLSDTERKNILDLRFAIEKVDPKSF